MVGLHPSHASDITDTLNGMLKAAAAVELGLQVARAVVS